jgi:hypothetical protein
VGGLEAAGHLDCESKAMKTAVAKMIFYDDIMVLRGKDKIK